MPEKGNIEKVENALVDFICKAAAGEHNSENAWEAIPEAAQTLLKIWESDAI